MSTAGPAGVTRRAFESVRFREGYEQLEVDEFLDECEGELRARTARLAQRGVERRQA